jgi:biotin operon repressor
MNYSFSYYSADVQTDTLALPKTLQARYISLSARMMVHGANLGEPFDQTLLEMDWVASSLTNSIETAVKSSPISSPKTGEKILQHLREYPQCSTQQLGNGLGISKRAVLKQIEKLKQQGRLARIDSAKGGHWQVLEHKA